MEHHNQSLERSARALLKSAKAFQAAVRAQRARTDTAALFHLENEAGQAVTAYTNALETLRNADNASWPSPHDDELRALATAAEEGR